jgi:hypothetical protein
VSGNGDAQHANGSRAIQKRGPQGLKPACFADLSGPAEAGPFPSIIEFSVADSKLKSNEELFKQRLRR